MKTELHRRVMNFQTDSFQLMHHARYLEFMEEGRWMYAHENGLVEHFNANGLYHVVVNINIDYRSGAGFGDDITVETEVSRVTEKSVVFDQRVLREGIVLVEAEVVNVFLRRPGDSVVPVREMKSFWADIELATGKNLCEGGKTRPS